MPDAKQAPSSIPVGVDTSRASIARVYDAFLGGKDNFEVDREVLRGVQAAAPQAQDLAWSNRNFLIRSCRFLAGQAGITQYLDCGSGLPTAENTHQVAQAVAPRSRIVYVDNDPIVLVHARALLTSHAEGATAYIDADLRDPDRILADRALHETLDLTQPVALVLLAILHFIDDSEDPYAIVSRLLSALPSGSYLVVSHATYDPMPPEIVARLKAAIAGTGEKGGPRDREQFARFFAGLELVEPGIVPIGDWRPAPTDDPPDPAEAGMYAAVARVP